MAFFELKTPRDMLEKARREHTRLSTAFDIDNVFNFFVTVHHMKTTLRRQERELGLHLKRSRAIRISWTHATCATKESIYASRTNTAPTQALRI